MSNVLVVLFKALAGGLLVVALAVLSQLLEPKRFAGLFSAAPAIAIAGLTITLLTKGPADAHESSIEMLAGCLGMLCYALVTVRLLRSGHSLTSSAVGLAAWIVPTAAISTFLL